MIDRYVRNEPLWQPPQPKLPRVYVEPLQIDQMTTSQTSRPETPRAPAEWRRRNFAEVEVSFSPAEAMREACRCLRCDLQFTQPPEIEEREEEPVTTGGKLA